MKRTTFFRQVGGFIMGKGFYIVLFLCVATIGISGYYLVSVFNRGQESVPVPVGGGAQVVIPKDEGVEPAIPEPSELPRLERVEKEPEPVQRYSRRRWSPHRFTPGR